MNPFRETLNISTLSQLAGAIMDNLEDHDHLSHEHRQRLNRLIKVSDYELEGIPMLTMVLGIFQSLMDEYKVINGNEQTEDIKREISTRASRMAFTIERIQSKPTSMQGIKTRYW